MDTHAPLATGSPDRSTAPSARGERHTVAVVVKGYPRLSETFIAQELRGLECRGLRLSIWSLRLPYDPTTHPVHGEIAAPITYLPEYLWRAPRRVWRGWQRSRPLPGYRAARRAFLRDLLRDRTPNRIRRFGQALVLAAELPPETAGLYAHFLHTPASTTRYAAMLRQLPFVVSAHAKDIWTTPSWEIAEKIADAQWVTTCTAVGAAHLRACAAPHDAARVHLNYHGIDLDCFARPDRRIAERDGSDPAHPAILLSVGRLVAKKGYDDLLRALALLPDGLHWRFVHVGGGPLKRRLIRLAKQLGIDARIDWLGRQAQTEVLARLRTADLFVLASRIADDGDRDGLPNVLMEAQSQDVACVATRVAGIPELITDGVTGRLVEPRDTAALRDAIADLIIDTHARVRLGTAGAAWLRERFAMTAGHDAIAGALRGALFTPAGARRP